MTCPTCSHHDHPGLPYCGRVVRCFDEDCDADFHHCACAYPNDNAAWVPRVQAPDNARTAGQEANDA